MDKWPEGLRKDIEEILKSSPELLKILKEEKEFEDLMNLQNVQEQKMSLKDQVIDSDEVKDINSADQHD